MKKLDPKYVWLLFIQSAVGTIVSFGFIGIFFICPFIFGASARSANIFSSIALLGIIGLFIFGILTVIVSYFWARLSYNNYKYELKEDGFYKESGVITKKYVTIPYERIQNVDINRGIFARILGLSDLQIQTAGMSSGFGKYGAYGVATEGRLPGVSESDAMVIRDELIKRAKGAKGGI